MKNFILANNKTIKIVTLLLIFLMALRHSMFYLDFGYINTEMGHDQSIIGIFLIPVTSSFGILFFWGREKIKLKKIYAIKLIFVFLIPILLAIYHKNFATLFTFSTIANSGKPSFLILLPIVLSVLSANFLDSGTFFKTVIPILLFINIYTSNFIFHYLTLFIIFYYLNRFGFFLKLQKKGFISILLYLGIVILIKYLNIYRIPLVLELIMSFAFISALFFLVSLFPNFTCSIYSKKIVRGFSILYFYIFQGLLFSIAFNFRKQISFLILFIIVFTVSLYLSFMVNSLEKKFLKYLIDNYGIKNQKI